MSPLALLALLYLFGGQKKPVPAPRPPYKPPPAYPRPPVVYPAPPPGLVVAPVLPAPPAWPAVVPAGLPPFPGPGWVPDSPPPPPVVARAVALLPKLWGQGEGASSTEQTAGRWITFVARMMSGKKSVLAYRLAAPTAPVVAPPMTMAHAPAPGAPGVVPAVYRPPVPGMPIPARAAPAAAPAPMAPAAAPAPAPTSALPTLTLTHPNMRGPSVVYLQTKLRIATDGVFGPGTQGAVKAFQSAHGLKPDGVVGPITWQALG